MDLKFVREQFRSKLVMDTRWIINFCCILITTTSARVREQCSHMASLKNGYLDLHSQEMSYMTFDYSFYRIRYFQVGEILTFRCSRRHIIDGKNETKVICGRKEGDDPNSPPHWFVISDPDSEGCVEGCVTAFDCNDDHKVALCENGKCQDLECPKEIPYGLITHTQEGYNKYGKIENAQCIEGYKMAHPYKIIPFIESSLNYLKDDVYIVQCLLNQATYKMEWQIQYTAMFPKIFDQSYPSLLTEIFASPVCLPGCSLDSHCPVGEVCTITGRCTPKFCPSWITNGRIGILSTRKVNEEPYLTCDPGYGYPYHVYGFVRKVECVHPIKEEEPFYVFQDTRTPAVCARQCVVNGKEIPCPHNHYCMEGFCAPDCESVPYGTIENEVSPTGIKVHNHTLCETCINRHEEGTYSVNNTAELHCQKGHVIKLAIGEFRKSAPVRCAHMPGFGSYWMSTNSWKRLSCPEGCTDNTECKNDKECKEGRCVKIQCEDPNGKKDHWKVDLTDISHEKIDGYKEGSLLLFECHKKHIVYLHGDATVNGRLKCIVGKNADDDAHRKSKWINADTNIEFQGCVPGCLSEERDCEPGERCHELENTCCKITCPTSILNGALYDKTRLEHKNKNSVTCNRGFILSDGSGKFGDVYCKYENKKISWGYLSGSQKIVSCVEGCTTEEDCPNEKFKFCNIPDKSKAGQCTKTRCPDDVQDFQSDEKASYIFSGPHYGYKTCYDGYYMFEIESNKTELKCDDVTDPANPKWVLPTDLQKVPICTHRNGSDEYEQNNKLVDRTRRITDSYELLAQQSSKCESSTDCNSASEMCDLKTHKCKLITCSHRNPFEFRKSILIVTSSKKNYSKSYLNDEASIYCKAGFIIKQESKEYLHCDKEDPLKCTKNSNLEGVWISKATNSPPVCVKGCLNDKDCQNDKEICDRKSCSCMALQCNRKEFVQGGYIELVNGNLNVGAVAEFVCDSGKIYKDDKKGASKAVEVICRRTHGANANWAVKAFNTFTPIKHCIEGCLNDCDCPAGYGCSVKHWSCIPKHCSIPLTSNAAFIIKRGLSINDTLKVQCSRGFVLRLGPEGQVHQNVEAICSEIGDCKSDRNPQLKLIPHGIHHGRFDLVQCTPGCISDVDCPPHQKCGSNFVCEVYNYCRYHPTELMRLFNGEILNFDTPEIWEWKCIKGYKLVHSENSKISCDEKAQKWLLPRCCEEECNVCNSLTPLKNGDIYISNGNKFQAEGSLRCHVGYYIDGTCKTNATLVCSEKMKGWVLKSTPDSPILPSCTRIDTNMCCHDWNCRHNEICKKSDNGKDNTSVLYTCQMPTCPGVLSASTLHGTLEGGHNHLGAFKKFVCHRGYYYSNAAQSKETPVICQKRNSDKEPRWYGTDGKILSPCVKGCSDDSDCNEEFIEKKYRCEYMTKTCMKLECPAFIEGGLVFGSNRNIGESAIFSCKKKHHLTFDSRRYWVKIICKAFVNHSPKWLITENEEPPACQREPFYCSDPLSYTNGKIKDAKSKILGSTANFNCNPNHFIISSLCNVKNYYESLTKVPVECTSNGWIRKDVHDVPLCAKGCPCVSDRQICKAGKCVEKCSVGDWKDLNGQIEVIPESKSQSSGYDHKNILDVGLSAKLLCKAGHTHPDDNNEYLECHPTGWRRKDERLIESCVASKKCVVYEDCHKTEQCNEGYCRKTKCPSSLALPNSVILVHSQFDGVQSCKDESHYLFDNLEYKRSIICDLNGKNPQWVYKDTGKPLQDCTAQRCIGDSDCSDQEICNSKSHKCEKVKCPSIKLTHGKVKYIGEYFVNIRCHGNSWCLSGLGFPDEECHQSINLTCKILSHAGWNFGAVWRQENNGIPVYDLSCTPKAKICHCEDDESCFNGECRPNCVTTKGTYIVSGEVTHLNCPEGQTIVHRTSLIDHSESVQCYGSSIHILCNENGVLQTESGWANPICEPTCRSNKDCLALEVCDLKCKVCRRKSYEECSMSDTKCPKGTICALDISDTKGKYRCLPSCPKIPGTIIKPIYNQSFTHLMQCPFHYSFFKKDPLLDYFIHEKEGEDFIPLICSREGLKTPTWAIPTHGENVLLLNKTQCVYNPYACKKHMYQLTNGITIRESPGVNGLKSHSRVIQCVDNGFVLKLNNEILFDVSQGCTKSQEIFCSTDNNGVYSHWAARVKGPPAINIPVTRLTCVKGCVNITDCEANAQTCSDCQCEDKSCSTSIENGEVLDKSLIHLGDFNVIRCKPRHGVLHYDVNPKSRNVKCSILKKEFVWTFESHPFVKAKCELGCLTDADCPQGESCQLTTGDLGKRCKNYFCTSFNPNLYKASISEDKKFICNKGYFIPSTGADQVQNIECKNHTIVDSNTHKAVEPCRKKCPCHNNEHCLDGYCFLDDCTGHNVPFGHLDFRDEAHPTKAILACDVGYIVNIRSDNEPPVKTAFLKCNRDTSTKINFWSVLQNYSEENNSPSTLDKKVYCVPGCTTDEDCGYAEYCHENIYKCQPRPCSSAPNLKHSVLIHPNVSRLFVNDVAHYKCQRGFIHIDQKTKKVSKVFKLWCHERPLRGRIISFWTPNFQDDTACRRGCSSCHDCEKGEFCSSFPSYGCQKPFCPQVIPHSTVICSRIPAYDGNSCLLKTDPGFVVDFNGGVTSEIEVKCTIRKLQEYKDCIPIKGRWLVQGSKNVEELIRPGCIPNVRSCSSNRLTCDNFVCKVKTCKIPPYANIASNNGTEAMFCQTGYKLRLDKKFVLRTKLPIFVTCDFIFGEAEEPVYVSETKKQIDCALECTNDSQCKKFQHCRNHNCISLGCSKKMIPAVHRCIDFNVLPDFIDPNSSVALCCPYKGYSIHENEAAAKCLYSIEKGKYDLSIDDSKCYEDECESDADCPSKKRCNYERKCVHQGCHDFNPVNNGRISDIIYCPHSEEGEEPLSVGCRAILSCDNGTVYDVQDEVVASSVIVECVYDYSSNVGVWKRIPEYHGSYLEPIKHCRKGCILNSDCTTKEVPCRICDTKNKYFQCGDNDCPDVNHLLGYEFRPINSITRRTVNSFESVQCPPGYIFKNDKNEASKTIKLKCCENTSSCKTFWASDTCGQIPKCEPGCSKESEILDCPRDKVCDRISKKCVLRTCNTLLDVHAKLIGPNGTQIKVSKVNLGFQATLKCLNGFVFEGIKTENTIDLLCSLDQSDRSRFRPLDEKQAVVPKCVKGCQNNVDCDNKHCIKGTCQASCNHLFGENFRGVVYSDPKLIVGSSARISGAKGFKFLGSSNSTINVVCKYIENEGSKFCTSQGVCGDDIKFFPGCSKSSECNEETEICAPAVSCKTEKCCQSYICPGLSDGNGYNYLPTDDGHVNKLYKLTCKPEYFVYIDKTLHRPTTSVRAICGRGKNNSTVGEWLFLDTSKPITPCLQRTVCYDNSDCPECKECGENNRCVDSLCQSTITNGEIEFSPLPNHCGKSTFISCDYGFSPTLVTIIRREKLNQNKVPVVCKSERGILNWDYLGRGSVLCLKGCTNNHDCREGEICEDTQCKKIKCDYYTTSRGDTLLHSNGTNFIECSGVYKKEVDCCYQKSSGKAIWKEKVEDCSEEAVCEINCNPISDDCPRDYVCDSLTQTCAPTKCLQPYKASNGRHLDFPQDGQKINTYKYGTWLCNSGFYMFLPDNTIVNEVKIKCHKTIDKFGRIAVGYRLMQGQKIPKCTRGCLTSDDCRLGYECSSTKHICVKSFCRNFIPWTEGDIKEISIQGARQGSRGLYECVEGHVLKSKKTHRCTRSVSLVCQNKYWLHSLLGEFSSEHIECKPGCIHDDDCLEPFHYCDPNSCQCLPQICEPIVPHGKIVLHDFHLDPMVGSIGTLVCDCGYILNLGSPPYFTNIEVYCTSLNPEPNWRDAQGHFIPSCIKNYKKDYSCDAYKICEKNLITEPSCQPVKCPFIEEVNLKVKYDPDTSIGSKVEVICADKFAFVDGRKSKLLFCKRDESNKYRGTWVGFTKTRNFICVKLLEGKCLVSSDCKSFENCEQGHCVRKVCDPIRVINGRVFTNSSHSYNSVHEIICDSGHKYPPQENGKVICGIDGVEKTAVLNQNVFKCVTGCSSNQDCSKNHFCNYDGECKLQDCSDQLPRSYEAVITEVSVSPTGKVQMGKVICKSGAFLFGTKLRSSQVFCHNYVPGSGLRPQWKLSSGEELPICVTSCNSTSFCPKDKSCVKGFCLPDKCSDVLSDDISFHKDTVGIRTPKSLVSLTCKGPGRVFDGLFKRSIVVKCFQDHICGGKKWKLLDGSNVPRCVPGCDKHARDGDCRKDEFCGFDNKCHKRECLKPSVKFATFSADGITNGTTNLIGSMGQLKCNRGYLYPHYPGVDRKNTPLFHYRDVLCSFKDGKSAFRDLHGNDLVDCIFGCNLDSDCIAGVKCNNDRLCDYKITCSKSIEATLYGTLEIPADKLHAQKGHKIKFTCKSGYIHQGFVEGDSTTVICSSVGWVYSFSKMPVEPCVKIPFISKIGGMSKNLPLVTTAIDSNKIYHTIQVSQYPKPLTSTVVFITGTSIDHFSPHTQDSTEHISTVSASTIPNKETSLSPENEACLHCPGVCHNNKCYEVNPCLPTLPHILEDEFISGFVGATILKFSCEENYNVFNLILNTPMLEHGNPVTEGHAVCLDGEWQFCGKYSCEDPLFPLNCAQKTHSPPEIIDDLTRNELVECKDCPNGQECYNTKCYLSKRCPKPNYVDFNTPYNLIDYEFGSIVNFKCHFPDEDEGYAACLNGQWLYCPTKSCAHPTDRLICPNRFLTSTVKHNSLTKQVTNTANPHDKEPCHSVVPHIIVNNIISFRNNAKIIEFSCKNGYVVFDSDLNLPIEDKNDFIRSGKAVCFEGEWKYCNKGECQDPLYALKCDATTSETPGSSNIITLTLPSQTTTRSANSISSENTCKRCSKSEICYRNNCYQILPCPKDPNFFINEAMQKDSFTTGDIINFKCLNDTSRYKEGFAVCLDNEWYFCGEDYCSNTLESVQCDQNSENAGTPSSIIECDSCLENEVCVLGKCKLKDTCSKLQEVDPGIIVSVPSKLPYLAADIVSFKCDENDEPSFSVCAWGAWKLCTTDKCDELIEEPVSCESITSIRSAKGNTIFHPSGCDTSCAGENLICLSNMCYKLPTCSFPSSDANVVVEDSLLEIKPQTLHFTCSQGSVLRLDDHIFVEEGKAICLNGDWKYCINGHCSMPGPSLQCQASKIGCSKCSESEFCLSDTCFQRSNCPKIDHLPNVTSGSVGTDGLFGDFECGDGTVMVLSRNDENFALLNSEADLEKPAFMNFPMKYGKSGKAVCLEGKWHYCGADVCDIKNLRPLVCEAFFPLCSSNNECPDRLPLCNNGICQSSSSMTCSNPSLMPNIDLISDDDKIKSSYNVGEIEKIKCSVEGSIMVPQIYHDMVEIPNAEHRFSVHNLRNGTAICAEDGKWYFCQDPSRCTDHKLEPLHCTFSSDCSKGQNCPQGKICIKDACFEDLPCPQLDRKVAHAQIDGNGKWSTGEIMTYHCDPQYEIKKPLEDLSNHLFAFAANNSGMSRNLAKNVFTAKITMSISSGTAICLNGKWVTSHNDDVICVNPAEFCNRHIIARKNSGYIHHDPLNDIYLYQCFPGYSFSSQSSSPKVQAFCRKGSWKLSDGSPLPLCVYNACEEINEWEFKGIIDKETNTFICNEGYTSNGVKVHSVSCHSDEHRWKLTDSNDIKPCQLIKKDMLFVRMLSESMPEESTINTLSSVGADKATTTFETSPETTTSETSTTDTTSETSPTSNTKLPKSAETLEPTTEIASFSTTPSITPLSGSTPQTKGSGCSNGIPCDSIIQCEDGSDEKDCSYPSIAPHNNAIRNLEIGQNVYIQSHPDYDGNSSYEANSLKWNFYLPYDAFIKVKCFDPFFIDGSGNDCSEGSGHKITFIGQGDFCGSKSPSFDWKTNMHWQIVLHSTDKGSKKIGFRCALFVKQI